jgi:hypothetical protein
MKKRNKLILFVALMSSMLIYIFWVFYLSEPKYVDNCYRKVQKYDYLSIPLYYHDEDIKQEVINGIVLQVDSSHAIVKTERYNDIYYELNFKTSKYRIIGTGTIYHKINNFVGFNIMVITQVFIFIILIILAITIFTSFKSVWD